MRVVIDYIEELSYDPAASPIENLHALQQLPAGMHYLALAVRSRENAEAGRGLSWGWGGDLNDGVLNSMFNWFSVSCVSYAGLVVTVKLMGENRWNLENLRQRKVRDALKAETKAYADKVIPEIVSWRHKVGAHTALADPRIGDDDAMLSSSVMSLVTFRVDRIYAGNRSERGSFALAGVESPLTGWSLTNEFERLAPRWWPERKVPRFRPGTYKVNAKEACTGCDECKMNNFKQVGNESCKHCGCSWKKHPCVGPDGRHVDHTNSGADCEWFFSVSSWVHREHAPGVN